MKQLLSPNSFILWINAQKSYQLAELYLLMLFFIFSPNLYRYFSEENIPQTQKLEYVKEFQPIKELYKIEKIAKKGMIKVVNTQIEDKAIVLNISSSKEKLFQFLNSCEKLDSHLLLKNIELSNETKNQQIDAKLYLEYSSLPIEILGNFITKKNKINTFKSQQSYSLNAIIGENVKIDNIWYKKGDIVNQYIITKILNNKVLLKSDKNELTLEVYENVKY